MAVMTVMVGMSAVILATFATLDWVVLGGYFAVLAVAGVLLSRRRRGVDEYFLADRKMPVWAVALSVMATAISGATFIGVPFESYSRDMTYLSTYLGTVLAAGIVAVFFIPAFYRHNVATVYQLLEVRFGVPAKVAASGMFMVGRVFASGARLYMAALAGSMILYGDTADPHIFTAIALLSVIGIAFTLVGGIATVIWTDVIQTVVFVGAGVAAIVLLVGRIPADFGQVIGAMTEPGVGRASKLTLITLGTDGFGSQHAYTLLTALFGFTLIGIGAFGTDQDLTQRMLTCRSAGRGSWSAFTGIVANIPVALIFMVVGLLLWVFYQRPDLMGDAAPGYAVEKPREVFLTFIMREMPAGMRGLMMCGLFAAALGNSTLNAMASTFVYDFYQRLRPGRGERHYMRVGQWGVVTFGVVLGLFAIASLFWLRRTNDTLIDFALKVMTFAYSGLVAVYLTALFTRRGNNASVLAALTVGFVTVLLMQLPWQRWGFRGIDVAFPWQMTVATAIAFVVCCAGRAKVENSRVQSSTLHTQVAQPSPIASR